MTGRARQSEDLWYRTDNAGRMFASLSRWRINSVFRVSASLRRPVNVERLSGAVERVMPRFPYFAVHLRPGMFWYYFEPNPAVPGIRRDSRYPCNELNYRRRHSFPFRVRVFHKRIALEVAHLLTDGTGAVAFLRAIVAEYLGWEPGAGADAPWMHPGEEAQAGEFEDAFRRYYRPGLPSVTRMERAFRIPGKLEPRGIRHITTGILELGEVRRVAKAQGATIGEFLVAAYLFALYQVWRGFPGPLRSRLARPIRLDVPVNLRSHLPSRTMRNFFLPVFPEIDPRLGAYTWEEMVRGVHHFMRAVLQEKYFLQMIGRNVSAEQNPLLRGVPLLLKNLILPEIYTRWNLTLATSGFSNVGAVTMPGCGAAEVERFDFVPAHPSTRGINCGAISYGDRLHICFNSLFTAPVVERSFFRMLSHLGLRIRVETNQR